MRLNCRLRVNVTVWSQLCKLLVNVAVSSPTETRLEHSKNAPNRRYSASVSASRNNNLQMTVNDEAELEIGDGVDDSVTMSRRKHMV